MHGIVGQRTLGGTCWLLYSCVGSDTIDFRFRFRFSAESPSLLSVAHSLRFRPNVEFPLSVDLYFEQHAVNKIPFAQLTGDNT